MTFLDHWRHQTKGFSHDSIGVLVFGWKAELEVVNECDDDSLHFDEGKSPADTKSDNKQVQNTLYNIKYSPYAATQTGGYIVRETYGLALLAS